MKRTRSLAALGLWAAALCVAQMQPGLLAVKAKQLAFVRAPAAAEDARRLVEGQRANRSDDDPEFLEALSWVARAGAFVENWDLAGRYAEEAHRKATTLAAAAGVDSSPYLATALGASIEVLALAMNAGSDRAGAVGFLRGEREAYRGTSIETRIQKNLLLLDLEGKPMPELVTDRFLGGDRTIDVEGKVALFYFWAHWCADCRRQKPILESIHKKHGDEGLAIIAPTQLFGYTAGGADATPEQEIAYLRGPWQQENALPEWMPVPLSETNWRNFGVSTTPTLVLVDRQGIVRLYHPGWMTAEELEKELAPLL